MRLRALLVAAIAAVAVAAPAGAAFADLPPEPDCKVLEDVLPDCLWCRTRYEDTTIQVWYCVTSGGGSTYIVTDTGASCTDP